MGWLTRLFGSAPDLTPEQRLRLEAWRRLPEADPKAAFEHSRYVVVDVETSGLDLVKDRLIAIGAVAVVDGRIALNDSLDIVLQQEEPSSKENILIHGIGHDAQRAGVPPAEALLVFLEYLGKSPLVAFHVAFDRTMIGRALDAHLGLGCRRRWVDLAYVAPALYPDQARRCRALDDWTGHFGIGNYARHSALADALATAELLLALRPRLKARKAETFRGMEHLEQERRLQANAY
jgi:DNA polymerase-3 subunit epsilon